MIMDTFNSEFGKNEFEEELLNNSIIDIWVEVNGRKKNTYIHGWELELSELKDHLRTIKKKKGCNGTIKNITNEEYGTVSVLQLQGNHAEYVKTYIVNTGIDNDNIRIKG
jgi:translation initiation factor 1 (eIF-1/SUI1)